MFIMRIKVIKLYGLHNYDIYFDEAECVKIIHAPNGFGKTTILKMVKAILEGDYEEIRKVPFEVFEIQLENNIEVKVSKQEEILVYTIRKQDQVTTYYYEAYATKQNPLTNILTQIREAMPIYFIDANRLWLETNHDRNKGKALLPTVLEYARELSERMREALTQSNFYGQELDSSFPMRLLKYLQDDKRQALPLEKIKEELEQLGKKRAVLAGAGLFADSSLDLPVELTSLDGTALKVLTLYIEDSKEKLRNFEDLATKINLLCDMINKHFLYKVMEVNMKDGFVFRVPTKEKLKADKLSSGEQNELILIFMLLFKAPRHALILMDEPEISLHIAWQQSFLKDMEAIATLSDIRMIIATHSPDIINGRWDLTTGLDVEE